MIGTINEIKATVDTVEDTLLQDNISANIEKSERLLSVGTGAFILLTGISNLFSRPRMALAEVVVGGFLIQRGVTGHCQVKAMIEERQSVPGVV